MLERIIEVRAQAEKQAQYYTNIGFAQLAAIRFNDHIILYPPQFDICVQKTQNNQFLFFLEYF